MYWLSQHKKLVNGIFCIPVGFACYYFVMLGLYLHGLAQPFMIQNTCGSALVGLTLSFGFILVFIIAAIMGTWCLRLFFGFASYPLLIKIPAGHAVIHLEKDSVADGVILAYHDRDTFDWRWKIKEEQIKSVPNLSSKIAIKEQKIRVGISDTNKMSELGAAFCFQIRHYHFAFSLQLQEHYQQPIVQFLQVLKDYFDQQQERRVDSEYLFSMCEPQGLASALYKFVNENFHIAEEFSDPTDQVQQKNFENNLLIALQPVLKDSPLEMVDFHWGLS